ncbi:hypothetical protein ONS95_013760 [Cadophora gregata]|uniref:uncharacterized protein n=1 Tax=Cadophora gregata TaxID=51156 RepID=UPI0026DBB034|nr:uncharacterized protein ONS95_013760 [Cadophora gregata]KAK0114263.1 hypothetical protein ONS95_013760 [Cadophora gregata]
MILEICQLKVKSSLSTSDPGLLSALSKARTELKERVHNTNSRFYQCAEDPTLIYILGVWPSLARHAEFLTSPEKSEILDSQEDLFDFGWILHMEVGVRGMDELPLDAPVMAITRLLMKDGDVHVKACEEIECKYREVIAEGRRQWNVVDGWRIDREDGKNEGVMITGWESVDAHNAFTKRIREAHPEYASVTQHYEKMEVRHANNMET